VLFGIILIMHETSLIKNMLAVVKKAKEERPGYAVIGITVELPAFGSMDEEHFKFHFNEEVKGTQWENLKLELIKVDSFELDPKLTHVTFREGKS
jgi:Zn finger protein HypA/HybF involved in hydrogenase expression